MSTLAELEKRLQRIESERAIERLIASYGPLVDAGEADSTAALWAIDGVYDVDEWLMRGRDDVAAMVRSDAHQGLIRRGCCHFLRRDDGYVAARAGANHFRLHRTDGRWEIVVRTTRALDGSAGPRELLSTGVAGEAR